MNSAEDYRQVIARARLQVCLPSLFSNSHYSMTIVRLAVIGHSQWLPYGHGTPYLNTFGKRPLFSSSTENWSM